MPAIPANRSWFGFALLASALLLAAQTTALAHVAPAVKENNRYIKVTVFPDRARIAYIIYYGEIPGQRARGELDKDGDGHISDAETRALAETWAQRVKKASSITVGGAASELEWQAVDVGMSDRSTSGGAFSIDLVAWACIEPGGSELVFRDNLDFDDPGETEVLPEESPGTEITAVRLGDGTEPTLRWNGDRSPLAGGLSLAWTSSDRERSQQCRDIEARRAATRRAWLPFAGAGAALATLGVVFLLWRRRRD